MPGTPTCSGSGSTAVWGSYLLVLKKLVFAVVVVGVVLLAGAPIAARY